MGTKPAGDDDGDGGEDGDDGCYDDDSEDHKSGVKGEEEWGPSPQVTKMIREDGHFLGNSPKLRKKGQVCRS